jgi:hypothetical protein
MRVWRVRVLMRVREARGRTRFIEGDVAVGADAQDLQVHPTGGADGVLVALAGGGNVGRQAVGALDGPGLEVHPRGELLVDDVGVPLRVSGVETDVLVEGERPGFGEGDLPGVMACGEVVVDRQRGGAGREAEDGIRGAVDQCGHGVRGELTGGVGVREDDDFHGGPYLFSTCSSSW